MHRGLSVAVFWATGFFVTSSSLPVADSERSTFPDSSFVATGFPIYPPRCASFSRAWELDASSDSEFPLILLLGFPWSSEYPQTFGCNRTCRGWGTCRNMRRQVHHCRFRFCHTSFFFPLFLHPLRHRLWAAYQAVFSNVGSRAAMTASLSSKTYNTALEPQRVPLDGTWSMLVRSGLVFVDGICFRMFDWGVADKFLRGFLTSLTLLVWFGEEWNTSITRSQRSRVGIPSMRKTASRETTSASVELC